MVEVGESLSLECYGYSANSTITWLQTSNKTGLFYVVASDRINIARDGSHINFTNVNLYDEEYYACGTVSLEANTFELISSYYLYVEVMPELVLFLNGRAVGVNDTLALVANDNSTYKIACASINSRPDVELFIYDTGSQVQLSSFSGSRYQKSKTCDDRLGLCSNLLEVSFRFDSNYTLWFNSLSCSAVSTDKFVELVSTITRKVSAYNPSQSIHFPFSFYFPSCFSIHIRLTLEHFEQK